MPILKNLCFVTEVFSILIKKNYDLVARAAFALHLAPATFCFGLHAFFLLGRLLIIAAQFHFPKNAFTLHFLFQDLQSLFHVIIAYVYCYQLNHLFPVFLAVILYVKRP